MASYYLPRLASYFTDANSETTLPESGSKQVTDETSPIVDETSSPKSCDGNLCKESNEKLRNQCQDLENKIKQLTESNDRALEEKNDEVLHYAKRLKELEERNKFLEREIEELRKKDDKSLNAMKQKIGSTYTEKLKSKQKQLDDYHKRLLDEQSKSHRLDQTLRHYASRLSQEQLRSKKLEDDLEHSSIRLSQEQFRSKKLEDDLEHSSISYYGLRDHYNKDLKMMAGEKDDLKTRLSKKEDELKVLQEELREKAVRLASIFEKRLKNDQRRVENTVEFNTPTDLEKDFRDFFDGERIDACDVMESILNCDDDNDVEIYYPRLACIIFVTAYEVVKEAREAACDLFSNVTKQLLEETPRMSQELCLTRKEDGLSSHFPITIDVSAKKRDKEISSDVLDGLMLSLKQTAHVCNLDCFENVVAGFVRERWKKYLVEDDTQSLPAFSEEVLAQLSEYIKACVRLTWRMVTQVPPLQLEYNAVNFDKNIHKLTRFKRSTEHSSCDDQRFGGLFSENIACYLWPALLEAGGRIIFPGEVLCKLESDYVIV